MASGWSAGGEQGGAYRFCRFVALLRLLGMMPEMLLLYSQLQQHQHRHNVDAIGIASFPGYSTQQHFAFPTYSTKRPWGWPSVPICTQEPQANQPWRQAHVGTVGITQHCANLAESHWQASN